MFLRRLLVALALALSACQAPAVGPQAFVARTHAPRVAPFDVLHYELALELEPAARALVGVATLRLAPLPGSAPRRVELDLVGLTVDEVRDGAGRALAFEHARGRLAITLAQPLEPSSALTVRYHGSPVTGLYFARFDADGHPTQVFTHGQTEGSRGWFPCFDEPGERASASVTLQVPATWSTVGPGRCAESEVHGAIRRERWELALPHPSYLISFVAGEFARRSTQAGATELLVQSAPEFAAHLEPTFAVSADALAFLAEFAGTPYPHAKYAQSCVDNFPWGGMENVSATTLTPQILGDERLRRDGAPDGLIVHEAAHQWFGDLLTCADWSHLWLNEGFATYLALLYTERTHGHEDFLAELRELQEANLAEDTGARRRPTVWNVWKEPDDVFDTRPYGGAAARLHLLRRELGDGPFLAGVRAYVAAHRAASVVTDDLRAALEVASGRDLGPFFAQWFLRGGYPELELDWSHDARSGELELELRQVQALDGTVVPAFTLALELIVFLPQGEERTLHLTFAQRRQTFRFPLAEAPLAVRLDPEDALPKRLRQERTPAEWLVLAARDRVNGRREALLALARLAAVPGVAAAEAETWRAVLREHLASDTSAFVRADAATGLGLGPDEAARTALIEAALADPVARVRVAALAALRAFGRDEGLALVGEEAFEAAYSYATQAAAAALVACARPGRAFEFLRSALARPSPHDVLAGRLCAVLAELGDARVPDELLRLARARALAPTARAAAVDALARVAQGGAELSEALAPLLAEESFHLRAAAVRALVASGDERARRVLAAYHPRSRTAEERRVIEAWLVDRRR